MNKKSLLSISLIIVLAAGLFGWWRWRVVRQPALNSVVSGGINACQIFTPARAKQLLGAQIDNGGGNHGQSVLVSKDLALATCSYSQLYSPSATAAPLSAVLTIRSARTVTGERTNDIVFRALPKDAVTVAGYGSGAFWDVSSGQLNILSRHNWYLLSVGGLKAEQRSLDQTKQLADLIKSDL